MTPFYTPYSNTKRKIYISGPMSGHPDNNYAAFDEAAEWLRDKGYPVCSPADTSRYLSEHGELKHHEYLRFDFERVLEADFLVALPGWEQSLGALAEIHMAIRMGLLVYQWWGGGDPARMWYAKKVDYPMVVAAMHQVHTEAHENLAGVLGFTP